MRSIVNLAVLSLLSLGIFTSKSNLLNPPELVEAPGNTPASNPAPIMNQTTPVPQNIDREITGGWQTILDENFSGSWPWSGWTVVDLKLDNKIIYWGTDQYRYHSSNSAAWPARGGRDGRDPTIKTNDYFNNMDTRMIFGPFDLSDASTANISFWIWWQTETTNDILKFEISHDNSTFIEYGRWSGTSAGGQQINLSLDQFRGDTSVWVSWRFMSNASVVYDGPWVDDIFLQKFVLGKITAHGTFSYTDRDNSLVPASYTLVNLYDLDYDGTTELLATTFTQSDGTFQFPHIVNGGDDDLEDPNPNLDLWVRWETIYNDSVLAQHSVKNFNNQSYKWYSDVEWNVMDGADQEFNYFITAQDSSLPAMWIFHDQRRAWEYYFYDTNPAVDPGSVTVKWEISKN
jgi:hypothetical protein